MKITSETQPQKHGTPSESKQGLSRNAQKYRKDSEFRQNIIERSKRDHEKYSKYRVYRELLKIRKNIASRRDCIVNVMKRLEQMDKKLIQTIKKRDRLAQQWKLVREEIKRRENR